jgi:hypothetical protein
MRNRVSVGAAVAVLVMGGVLGAVAPRSASAEESELHHFQGNVVRVDAARRTLVLKQAAPGPDGQEDEARYTFVVRNDAEILSRGKPATLAQIAVGDRVSVTYGEARDMQVASRVEALPPAPPAGHRLPRRPGFLPPQRP